MNVLIVGSGGREHALAWKLARSPRKPRLFVAPGNGGTAALATHLDVSPNDIDGIVAAARRERIDLVVVGPEEPLCAGLVDACAAAGLRAFGPCKAAARLEGDKAWAKQLMRACGVPTAEARIFGPTDTERAARRMAAERPAETAPIAGAVRSFDLAREYLSTRDSGVVVKAAGLAKGKGVFVCPDPADALHVVERLMVQRELGAAGETVVIEELLVGREASVLALVDGESIYLLEPARDYKRLADGDAGPNTGGMGGYSPCADLGPGLLDELAERVFVPIIDGLRRDEIRYRGVLYAGLMLTAGGPKVLEFNCRFGDPETQTLIFRMRSDLLPLLEAVVDGRLADTQIEWDPRPAVCVVAAAPGYPDAPSTGAPIRGLAEAAGEPDVAVFHAGTRTAHGQVFTAGGRVLSVTARGDSFAAARARAYGALARVQFDGMQFRTDIAAEA
ncbi:MAG: phosphoribosylamine--glycine ligase [Phycisphaerae bacterium]